jgi:glycosyltransferase involved in cell wall biosynthesis
MTGSKAILMVGADPELRGGVATVIRTYRAAGLFASGTVEYVSSHQEGSRWKKSRAFAVALSILLSRLARGSVRGVHAHAASSASFWRKSMLLAIARAFGVKTIFHLHGGGFEHFAERRCGALARRWVRHTLEASDGVIVLSPRWAAWIRRFAPAARVHVLGNPVHLPAVPDEGKRTLVLVYLGLVSDAKGCFDLLRAFGRLAGRYSAWRLVVAGHGEIDRLREEAARTSLSGVVEVPGWIDPESRDALLDRAAIYVLPSYAEGLPMGMLEAMAHGVAVVATRVGGVPDTISDDVDGILVPPGDINALAAALERLMGDPALRQSIGRAGRQSVARFSTDRILSRLNEILTLSFGASPTVPD